MTNQAQSNSDQDLARRFDLLISQVSDLNTNTMGNLSNFLVGVQRAARQDIYRNDLLQMYHTLSESLDEFAAICGFAKNGERTLIHNSLTSIKGQVYREAEQLDFALRMGYQRPAVTDLTRPPSSFIVSKHLEEIEQLLSGGSQSIINPEKFNSIEESIRFLHEVAIKQLQQRLAWYASCSSERQIGNIPYLGALTEGEFANSPMGKVSSAINDYFYPISEDRRPSELKFNLAVFTDRAFRAEFKLGHHFLTLSIISEHPADNFQLSWKLNEPGHGYGRFTSVPALFEPKGFHYKREHWQHIVTSTLSSANIHEGLQYALFVAENINNADLAGLRHPIQKTIDTFNLLYRRQRLNTGRITSQELLSDDEYQMRLGCRPSWTEQEKQLLELLLIDPFPMFLECPLIYFDPLGDRHRPYPGSSLAISPPFLHFIAAHAKDLYPDGISISQAVQLTSSTLDVLFQCFEINSEQRSLNPEGSSIEISLQRVHAPFGNAKNTQARISSAIERHFLPTVEEILAKSGRERASENDKVNVIIPVDTAKLLFELMQGFFFPKTYDLRFCNLW